MDSDAERKERIQAFVEQVRREMDKRGISGRPDAEAGYEALLEAARQSGAEDPPQEETHRGQREQ
jgi:hypothetical protein